MSEKDDAKTVIDSYKKRQQRTPFVVGGLAIVLVVSGLLILALWLTGPDGPGLAFLAADTPTATPSLTPTPLPPTSTRTPQPPTATQTETPTVTITPTASAPFIYIVQEGDTCFSIAEQFGVAVVVLLDINALTADCPIFPGTELVVPPPGTELSTPTPFPTGFVGRIEYRIQEGDTLDALAIQFFTTVESILEENEGLENPNEIAVGQIINIFVGIATPAPTLPPTSVGGTPGSVITLTPTP
ncbi:MAG TPA: LysM peptidoglycan-binding domain-containing protein [Anaerolineales bacterium]|nr:LysM peptidoglycan-binding domain-containing protein [Anaerolineales bacterium]